MHETAAHLVDEVLPKVPVRQWVCSFSWELRYAMGYDPKLASAVFGAFMRTVQECIARRVKRERGLRSVHEALTGAVLFVQRFDSALRLNPHAHSLVLEGAYVKKDTELEFVELDEPNEDDVLWVAQMTWLRVERVLTKHPALDDAEHTDALHDKEPFLADCYAQAVAGRGEARVLGANERPDSSVHKRLVAQVGGVNIHADVAVPGTDRERIERLCRYMTRPPIAQERLYLLPDGRVQYFMKRAWRDGTTSVVMDPMQFIARLCALVPSPYFHMTRYYGVLAPNATARSKIVPKLMSVPALQLALFEERDLPFAPPRSTRPSRIAWAALLKRVFKVDVTVCPSCDGTMRITDAVTKRDDIIKVLAKLGLPTDPPTIHPARAPPQQEFSYQDDLESA